MMIGSWRGEIQKQGDEELVALTRQKRVVCGCRSLLSYSNIAAAALHGGSVSAKEGTSSLDGSRILRNMAAQFSGAQNLAGRVTVLIQKDGVSVSVTGDIKIKDWEQLRLDCESDNPVIPTTIITDGELVAYYMPNSTKPRIAHDPSEIGFPLITDLSLAAFTQLHKTHAGDLLEEKEVSGP